MLFAARGLWWCALGAAFVGGCVVVLAFFYGDHAGRVLFVVDRAALRRAVGAWSGRGLAPRLDGVGPPHRRAPAADGSR